MYIRVVSTVLGEKLDTLTVSMKHPDALISLLSQHSSISAHVSSSPFQEQELASPGPRRCGQHDEGGQLGIGLPREMEEPHHLIGIRGL